MVRPKPENDSAVILFPVSDLELPAEPLPMIAADRVLKVGAGVGWLGFPSIARGTLCFFNGTVSAQQEDAYFIDGVAINGVSGGPVFNIYEKGVRIIGTISSYYPNFAQSGTLPGLLFAQDVTHFHDSIAWVRSIDEAKEVQQDEQKEQAASALGPGPGEPSTA